MMGNKAEFHDLIERLVDHDTPLDKGELQTYRKNIEQSLLTAQRRLRTCVLVVLCGIPATFVGQIVALQASNVESTMPAWIGYVAMVLAFTGMILVPIAILWLVLFYVPRYFQARWDLRDSLLALLVTRVDELAQRLERIEGKS
jgi:hypothetical protein